MKVRKNNFHNFIIMRARTGRKREKIAEKGRCTAAANPGGQLAKRKKSAKTRHKLFRGRIYVITKSARRSAAHRKKLRGHGEGIELMFMITLKKAGLRRAGAVLLCGAVLAGAVVIGHYTGGEAISAGATAQTKIESTQDIAAYFAAFGLEVDPAGITADKVKVPKKWDDSFSAFNEVVAQSGQDLTKFKGKTVEKWLAEIPSLSTGSETVYGVLLVYDKKTAGAYLLSKPSGNVTGMADAAKNQASSKQAASTAAEGDTAASQVSDETGGAASQVSADLTEAEQAALDVDLTAGADGYPVE